MKTKQPLFSVVPTTVPTTPGCWHHLKVEIFDSETKKVGEYLRNYGSLYQTFYPFFHHGEAFALYSRDYTATRVMRLPSCQDVAGEERNSMGFCPVQFFVPYDPFSEINGDFGFVAGCVWGDDNSWKVQFLDLSKIREGKLIRDDRFGYLELPAGVKLADAVELFESNRVKLATTKSFDFSTNPAKDLGDGYL